MVKRASAFAAVRVCVRVFSVHSGSPTGSQAQSWKGAAQLQEEEEEEETEAECLPGP